MGRRALLVASLVVVFGACSGDTSPTTSSADTTAAPTTTSRPTTTTAAPTTTTSVTTSTMAVTSVPADDNPAAIAAEQFDTTGDDLVAVMQAWRKMFAFFEHNPTGTAEQIVDLLYTATSTRREGAFEGFAELVDNDWHYVDPGTRLRGVKVIEVDGDRAVVWEAIDRGW